MDRSKWEQLVDRVRAGEPVRDDGNGLVDSGAVYVGGRLEIIGITRERARRYVRELRSAAGLPADG